MRFVILVVAAAGICLSGCGKNAEQRRAEAEAAWVRGNAQLDARNFDSATAEYTRAIELDDTFALALVARGNAKIGLQQYDAARADLDAAIAADPSLSDAYHSRATLAWLIGDLDSAASDFRTLTEMRPGDSFYADRYAGVLYEQGDKAGAEAVYRQAYEGDASRDWAVLGWLFAINETRGPEAMRSQAASLYAAGDQRMAVRYAVGEGYFLQRDYYSAIPWLSSVLNDDVTSTPTDAISNLAAAYVLTGQQSMCEQVWRNYLQRIGRLADFNPSQCTLETTP